MNEQEIRTAIKELAEMNILLLKRGGVSKNSKLLDAIYEKEEEILEHYNFPSTPYYTGLLRFNSIPWDNDIEKKMELLEIEKEKYKIKPIKTKVQLLQEAKKTNRNPMHILPKLGFKTHVYTIYIYDNILMHEQDTPENVLKELQIANNNEILDITGKIGTTMEWLKDAEQIISSLEAKGLKHIRKYVKKIKDDLKKMGFEIDEF